MPLPAIAFFSKVSMHKREIGLAHSSPPFSYHDTHLHEFHVHSMNIYFFWLHLAFTWVTLWLRFARFALLVLDLHLDSKWFLPPQLWQVLPKAGHSPLLWDHPQNLQSVYWDFADLFLISSTLTKPGLAIPSIFLWANFDSIFLASYRLFTELSVSFISPRRWSWISLL